MKKYNIDPAILFGYARQCLMEWKINNSDYDIEEDIDLSGRFYEQNLACILLFNHRSSCVSIFPSKRVDGSANFHV